MSGPEPAQPGHKMLVEAYYNAAPVEPVSPRSAPVARITGLAGLVGGSLVLVGWIFNIRFLIQPTLSVPSMKVNTAVAIAACGASLWCLATRRFTGAAPVLAVVVAAIGLAQLSQDLFGWNLGIDQLVFPDPTALDGFHPGRMSPLAAFSFASLGLALLTSTRPGGAWRTHGLVMGAAVLPTVSLASYALSLHELYGIASYRAMAVHTALLLLTLAVGVLYLKPTEGLTGLLRSPGITGQATRRILSATVLIPIGVERLRLAGQQRGLYDPDIGIAFFVICTIVLLSVVILWTARLVQDADVKRHDAEDALRRSNETLETRVTQKTAEAQRNLAQAAENAEMFFHLFESSPDAVVAINPNGVIERVNARTGRIFGYSREELVGQPMDLLIPDQFIARHIADRSDAAALGTTDVATSLELRARQKDGREFPADVRLVPAESPQGLLVLGVVRDITERKLADASFRAAEERLQAGQRMEAMGRLAGGVAHDFNNMMTVVTGYSELLLGRIGGDDPSRKAIQEIKKAGERCAALTRHLLAFSRRQMLTPSTVDLNAIVADLCAMLPVLLGEDIKVVNRPGPNLWAVRADPAQLEQVIVNLAVNARDAMPRGGTLTIETANVDLNGQSMPDHPEITPGPFVSLTVRDSGHGMDAATKARVFDPFFTTKPVGQGTGLGLSTVYGVIKQSQGYIYVDSEPDHGTAFHIYLPRVLAETTSIGAGAPTGEPNGRETVLLVEDENAVRLLLGDVLEGAGYRVIGATDAYQALRICEQFRDAIQLVVTDVVMPGMSGGELVERLATIRPETRVLLMSGYTQNVVLEHAVAQPGTAFIQKPFTPGTLLRRVRDVLAGAAP